MANVGELVTLDAVTPEALEGSDAAVWPSSAAAAAAIACTERELPRPPAAPATGLLLGELGSAAVSISIESTRTMSLTDVWRVVSPRA